jgi:hypothetical protein
VTVASAEGGACFRIAEMTVAVAFVASPTDSLNHYPHHRFEGFLAREEVVCEASADVVQKNSEVEFGNYSVRTMIPGVGAVVVHVTPADLILQIVAAAAVNAAFPLHSVHRLAAGLLRDDSVHEYEDDEDW